LGIEDSPASDMPTPMSKYRKKSLMPTPTIQPRRPSADLIGASRFLAPPMLLLFAPKKGAPLGQDAARTEAGSTLLSRRLRAKVYENQNEH
jgi:hypothetical protein